MLGLDKLDPKAQQWGLLAVIAVIALWYVGRKAGAAVEGAIDSTLEAVNPTNDENIFYSGVNAVGESLSGLDGWSLGSATYDTFNPDFDGDGVPDAGPTDVLSGMAESIKLWFTT